MPAAMHTGISGRQHSTAQQERSEVDYRLSSSRTYSFYHGRSDITTEKAVIHGRVFFHPTNETRIRYDFRQHPGGV